MEKEMWVVEVTEQSKLGTFSPVCYASTVEEGVSQAKIEIRGQRPRFQGKPMYSVRAAKLNEEAEDFIMTERSDAFVMAQGISDVEAFRSGMRQRLAAPVVNVYVEGKTTAVFTQSEESQKAAA